MSNDNTITGVGGRLMKGDTGSLEIVARIQTWSIDPSVGDNAWGDSDGAGFTLRRAGRKDMTGSVTGKYDTSSKIFHPTNFREGTELDLALFAAAGTYWYVPVVITSGPAFEIDVDTEDVVGWSFDFGSTGRFYLPGEAGIPVVSLP